jgi:hypothetical protein
MRATHAVFDPIFIQYIIIIIKRGQYQQQWPVMMVMILRTSDMTSKRNLRELRGAQVSALSAL